MLRLLVVLALLGVGGLLRAREHVALLGTFTDEDSRGIYVVRLDADTGALSTPELAAELSYPEFFALHPNGRLVYSMARVPGADGKPTGAIAAFALEPATGRLTLLNIESTGQRSLCHLALDATHRMLVAVSYGGGYVASFPVLPDGRVGPVKTLLPQTGPLGPNTARQEKPHPHSVTLSPDNRFAFVADLGVDRVFAYRLSPEDGSIAPHDPAFATFAPGAGPRHTKFSGDGQAFYVLDELDCTVTACRYEPARGVIEPFQRVSTLPADFSGENTTSEIRAHPNGRFVYAANRGHDSLAVFERNAETGALTRIEIVPCGGKTPRNFSLTPDGRWLLCAHMDSNTLAVFRVDADTGRLTRAGPTIAAPRVVCVQFMN